MNTSISKTPTRVRTGWQSKLAELVTADVENVVSSLRQFINEVNIPQEAAWMKSIEILKVDGQYLIEKHPQAMGHGSILEYELPREGGRRPDIILLQDTAVLVIEFKNKNRIHLGDIDQVAGYSRDLKDYHSECQGVPIIPILLYMGSKVTVISDGVIITTPNDFGKVILKLAEEHISNPPKLDLNAWVKGQYEPLPGIVQAARILFERQPLPFIRRAHSAGIPQTVDLILKNCKKAQKEKRHQLILLTGVPGAGKTLVGLQVVHNDQLNDWLPNSKQHLNTASFLSGNGPLVAVLQDALKSRTFVQDMHRFIREHAIEKAGPLPHERIIVFDEAQRAWTSGKVSDFYSKKGFQVEESEPELLIRLAQRMEEGCVILALIGTGQEIHTGEESGIQGWIDAISKSGHPEKWSIYSPPTIVSKYSFGSISVQAQKELDLNITLRSHAAEKLHEWVNGLLNVQGIPEDILARIADDLTQSAYPIIVTRDLDWAKEYAHTRFMGEENRRYGLLASSKAKNLPNHGVDNRYDRFFDAAKWFNAEPQHPKSCCQLTKPAQEFHCQGLELDLPIVCWGDDVWWDGEWKIKKGRTNNLVKDPDAFRRNTYRVLLTRGREGLLIYVPPGDEKMDSIQNRLVRCGASTLESRRDNTVKVA